MWGFLDLDTVNRKMRVWNPCEIEIDSNLTTLSPDGSRLTSDPLLSRARASVADMSPIPDELTATVISAVESLSALQKAKFLLEHSLTLLEAGQ
jgi:hypothetical protein